LLINLHFRASSDAAPYPGLKGGSTGAMRVRVCFCRHRRRPQHRILPTTRHHTHAHTRAHTHLRTRAGRSATWHRALQLGLSCLRSQRRSRNACPTIDVSFSFFFDAALVAVVRCSLIADGGASPCCDLTSSRANFACSTAQASLHRGSLSTCTSQAPRWVPGARHKLLNSSCIYI